MTSLWASGAATRVGATDLSLVCDSLECLRVALPTGQFVHCAAAAPLLVPFGQIVHAGDCTCQESACLLRAEPLG